MSVKNTSMDSVFCVRVQCGREFYTESNLITHSLLHRVCIYCGKYPHDLSQHNCQQIFNKTITKQQALHPYLYSCHYKIAAKYGGEDAYKIGQQNSWCIP